MKKSLLPGMKIWITIIISVLLVGMVLLGIFGFNKSIDYRAGYEVSVTANDILDDSVEIMKGTTEKYFKDNGLKPVKQTEQQLNGGETLIYKFNNDVSAHKEPLRAAVQAELDAKGLTVTVNTYETMKKYESYAGYAILAGCIVLVAVFLYNLIVDKKVAGGLAIVIISVLSVLVYMAFIAIIRASFAPFGVAMAVFTGLLAAVYCTGIIDKCKEIAKKSDKDLYEISKEVVNKSSTRISVTDSVIAVLAVLAVIFGGEVISACGLLMLAGTAMAALVSVLFVGPLWALLSGNKKPEKNKPAEKQEDSQE